MLLLEWYDKNKRILPWRQDKNPYHIWISEVMLQQTRVEAVKPYYQRFMKELPDVVALAEVKEDHLLKLWEGLGYYSRARNLKKGAQYICEQCKGKIPSEYEELIKVPGIGPYTAGAIASIAFDKPVAAVDGNVLRVWSRLLGSYEDISKASTKRMIAEKVEDILVQLPEDRSPGDFNQAIMDLGSSICIGNGMPQCENCPLQVECKARKEDSVLEIPVKPSKKGRKIEKKTVILLTCEEKYAIRKRKDTGLLAGMWEFLLLDGKYNIEQIESVFPESVCIQEMELLGEAVHVFSHVEWHMLGYKIHLETICSVSDLKLPISCKDSKEPEFIWKTASEIENAYSIPTAFKKYRLHL